MEIDADSLRLCANPGGLGILLSPCISKDLVAKGFTKTLAKKNNTVDTISTKDILIVQQNAKKGSS